MAHSRSVRRLELNPPGFYGASEPREDWSWTGMRVTSIASGRGGSARILAAHVARFAVGGDRLVTGRIDLTAETLREWVWRTEIDNGNRVAMSCMYRAWLEEVRARKTPTEASQQSATAGADR